MPDDSIITQYINACRKLNIRSCEKFLLKELDRETAFFYMNLVIEKAISSNENKSRMHPK